MFGWVNGVVGSGVGKKASATCTAKPGLFRRFLRLKCRSLIKMMAENAPPRPSARLTLFAGEKKSSQLDGTNRGCFAAD